MITPKQTIQQGKAILGIEFGSTRIKAVLIDGEKAESIDAALTMFSGGEHFISPYHFVFAEFLCRHACVKEGIQNCR